MNFCFALMSTASQTRINSSMPIRTRQLKIEQRLQVYDTISFNVGSLKEIWKIEK